MKFCYLRHKLLQTFVRLFNCCVAVCEITCENHAVNECLHAGYSESELLGLALDSERGLLYFTDKQRGIIAEIKTDGKNRREIFNDASKHPRAIAVDSESRLTAVITIRCTYCVQNCAQRLAPNQKKTEKK